MRRRFGQTARSSYLEQQFRRNPRSVVIAARLNRRGAALCKHGLSPCVVYCGIGRFAGSWEVIPKWRRVAWLCNLLDNVAHRPRRYPDELWKTSPLSDGS